MRGSRLLELLQPETENLLSSKVLFMNLQLMVKNGYLPQNEKTELLNSIAMLESDPDNCPRVERLLEFLMNPEDKGYGNEEW